MSEVRTDLIELWVRRAGRVTSAVGSRSALRSHGFDGQHSTSLLGQLGARLSV